MAEIPKKEIYTYQAPWTVYSQSWSQRMDQKFRLAIGSFLEDYTNKVEVIQLNEETGSFVTKGLW
jgi:DDB1- and CUL4-associated factor 7